MIPFPRRGRRWPGGCVTKVACAVGRHEYVADAGSTHGVRADGGWIRCPLPQMRDHRGSAGIVTRSATDAAGVGTEEPEIVSAFSLVSLLLCDEFSSHCRASQYHREKGRVRYPCSETIEHWNLQGVSARKNGGGRATSPARRCYRQPTAIVIALRTSRPGRSRRAGRLCRSRSVVRPPIDSVPSTRR